jgi:hypothetical protein
MKWFEFGKTHIYVNISVIRIHTLIDHMHSYAKFETDFRRKPALQWWYPSSGTHCNLVEYVMFYHIKGRFMPGYLYAYILSCVEGEMFE